jgi:hypothetical protein
VRAVKSNDLAVKETRFMGTLMFIQNQEPFRTKAQMERVISSAPFRSDAVTDKTGLAFTELLKIPLREMAWCYIEVMKQRKWIEAEWYPTYLDARNEILTVVPDNRLAENHGLALGFHRLAEKIFGAKLDLRPFVVRLAERKHRQCNHRQATLADHFFEACMEVSKEQLGKFQDLRDGKMFIRLPLALKILDGLGMKFYAAQLQKELTEHPAFLKSNHPHRSIWGDGQLASEVAKTWVFDAEKAIGFNADEVTG